MPAETLPFVSASPIFLTHYCDLVDGGCSFKYGMCGFVECLRRGVLILVMHDNATVCPYNCLKTVRNTKYACIVSVKIKFHVPYFNFEAATVV